MNHDIELALRFTTDIKSGDEFFTDLNGFQVIIWKRLLIVFQERDNIDFNLISLFL